MPKTPLKIACCLVFDKDNRLLLLRRHTDDLGGGLWALPGGKQEPGEAPISTVVREVKEETGLDLHKVEYLGLHELIMPHGIAHLKTYRSQVNGTEKNYY